MSLCVDGRKTSGGVAAMIERFESLRIAKSSRARVRTADDVGAATGGRAGRVSLLIRRFSGRSATKPAPAALVVPPERPSDGSDDATAATAHDAQPESATSPVPGTCCTATTADPSGPATAMSQGSETDVQTHKITSPGPMMASGDSACRRGRPRQDGGPAVGDGSAADGRLVVDVRPAIGGKPAVVGGPVVDVRPAAEDRLAVDVRLAVSGGRAAVPLADCWAPSALRVEPGLSSRRSEADRRRRRVVFVAEAQTLSTDGRLGHELVAWEPRPGRPWLRGGEWVGSGAERDFSSGGRNVGGGGGRRGSSRDGQPRRRSRGARRARGREA